MGQNDVRLAHRAERRIVEPGQNAFARCPRPIATGIVHHARRRIFGHLSEQFPDQQMLPFCRQMRREKVDLIAVAAGAMRDRVDLDHVLDHIGDQWSRPGTDRLRYICPAPDRGTQDALVRQAAIGPGDGARRDADLPCQFAHRGQAGAGGQGAPVDGGPHGGFQHRILWPGILAKRDLNYIRIRNCIHHNVSLDSGAGRLYL